ncbi:hypothetical protein GOODEAATRI_021569 [Goodea atripinnis]|uniref:Uncharacterized protein n=1 Tax=Goodea atripinnis TaxID=208336 RepID=A0ABV0MLK2_9TELE
MQRHTGAKTHAPTLRPEGILERAINIHLFGLWEEAWGEPTHARENMQTAKNVSGRDVYPGPFCCKATVLKTLQPQQNRMLYYHSTLEKFKRILKIPTLIGNLSQR